MSFVVDVAEPIDGNSGAFVPALGSSLPCIVEKLLDAFRGQERPAIGLLCQIERTDVVERTGESFDEIDSEVLVIVETAIDDRAGVRIKLTEKIAEVTARLSVGRSHCLLGIVFVLLLSVWIEDESGCSTVDFRAEQRCYGWILREAKGGTRIVRRRTHPCFRAEIRGKFESIEKECPEEQISRREFSQWCIAVYGWRLIADVRRVLERRGRMHCRSI